MKAPCRRRQPLSLAPAAVECVGLPEGGVVLRSRRELMPYPRQLGELLRHWARVAPERTFLAEREIEQRQGEREAERQGEWQAGRRDEWEAGRRDEREAERRSEREAERQGEREAGGHGPGGWRQVGYGAALDAVERIAGALLDRGLGAERPVVILSDNGVDNGLLQLAAMHVGIPVAPVSPAYSLLSGDHARLRHIVALIRPGLVYAADGERFAAALATAREAAAAAGTAAPGAGSGPELVVSANPPPGLRATLFGELMASPPGGAAVEARFAAVGPGTVAKVLFTSGSTGKPKGVINTQRMLCSNQQAIAQNWPFLAARPPVIVDWLPWSHTFGGNHNFNLVLRNGGTLYIDGGKPAPGLFATTLRNLREVASTLHFNVPRGFDMLVPCLASDGALREMFFRDLDAIFYAAAALPQHLWQELERLSIAATGERAAMLSAWGSTETAPCATQVHFPIERAGVIGLPIPGTEVLLAPLAGGGGKLELRVKGPNVTPGYWRDPGASAELFDRDGFLKTGDAGRLADAAEPAQGIVFDGRLAENFKLTSGSWVHVGELRGAVIAAGAPLIHDVVVTGHDRPDVGLLIFPHAAGCRSVCGGLARDAPLAELIARPEVRRRLLADLAVHNAANPASSRRIARALLVADPPAIDAGEITDKGYINQRAVLTRRAALVARLYEAAADAEVLVPAAEAALASGDSGRAADELPPATRAERLIHADADPGVVVQTLCRDLMLRGVNLNIHADDEMLLFFVFAQGHDLEQAVATYLVSGARIWATVRQIIAWRFGSPAGCARLLDFASGFGRVTRHMVAEVPAERVWVSDIYSESVAFQQRQFGVHGIGSTSDPNAFRCDTKFQCVLASSLFSHLPAATFTGWLRRLASLLTADGLLLFSVHDMSLRRDNADRTASGFHFQEMSESGSLAPREYGTAWVTEAYVRRAVEDAVGACAVRRIPRGLANYQDLYVVLPGNPPAPDAFSTLRLERYADGFVEHCSRLGKRSLRLSGWVADRVTGEPPREVRIRVDGELVACCQDLPPRPSLTQVFAADPMVVAGWQAIVQLPAGCDADGAELAVRPVSSAGEEMALFADSVVGALLRSAQLDRINGFAELRREAASRAELQASQVSLTARLSEQDRQLAERETRLAALQVRVAAAETQVAERGARLVEQQAQAVQRELRLGELARRVSAMEASRFWKLRNLWFRCKRFLGLTRET